MNSDWDPETALSFTEGDRDDLKELIEIWLNQLPTLMQAMSEGLDERDAPKLELAAHTLRGSLQILTQGDVINLAAQLEMAGRNEDFVAARPLYEQMQQRMALLEGDVRGFLTAS